MENKVAVITGASRGIGSALAIEYARNGYDVVINYNGNEEKANIVKDQCIALGVNAICIKANVSNVEEVADMFKATMQQFNRIDVLINNAGITKDTLLLRMKNDDFKDVIDINLNGTFNCIKEVSKIMMKQKSGVILNMSSVIGEIGNIGQCNYAASKAGIIGLTKSIAKELAAKNVRCNAIAPGFIKTDMTEVLKEDIKEKILTQIPLSTFGDGEDIANLALFLSSDKAKYITGQIINVDGGMVM